MGTSKRYLTSEMVRSIKNNLCTIQSDCGGNLGKSEVEKVEGGVASSLEGHNTSTGKIYNGNEERSTTRFSFSNLHRLHLQKQLEKGINCLANNGLGAWRTGATIN